LRRGGFGEQEVKSSPKVDISRDFKFVRGDGSRAQGEGNTDFFELFKDFTTVPNRNHDVEPSFPKTRDVGSAEIYLGIGLYSETVEITNPYQLDAHIKRLGKIADGIDFKGSGVEKLALKTIKLLIGQEIDYLNNNRSVLRKGGSLSSGIYHNPNELVPATQGAIKSLQKAGVIRPGVRNLKDVYLMKKAVNTVGLKSRV